MISLCIKTNNIKVINTLIANLNSIELNNVIFLEKFFSKYTNIIIHYIDNNHTQFFNKLSSIITKCIIENYEQQIIDYILLNDYFYFNSEELKLIKKNYTNLLTCSIKNLDINSNFSVKNAIIDKDHYLWSNVYDYISTNKAIYMDGFVTFRTKKYYNCLNSIIDFCVNQFVVKKEYSKFINMLQIYINSNPYKSNTIHLIYINEESILLDENKNIISFTKNNLDRLFLSDISFSSNDYVLNSLLTLLPKKIIIHLISPEDEFIETLKKIFNSHIALCNTCPICKNYAYINNSIKK